MLDEDAAVSARIQASNSTLDRGFGRPTQQLDVIETPRDISLNELANRLSFIDRLHKETTKDIIEAEVIGELPKEIASSNTAS